VNLQIISSFLPGETDTQKLVWLTLEALIHLFGLTIYNNTVTQ